MPDNIETAHFEFRQWILTMRGNAARSSKIGDVDPPARLHITVPPQQAIDCFTSKHPQWSKYADELRERDKSVTFSLVKELWDDSNN